MALSLIGSLLYLCGVLGLWHSMFFSQFHSMFLAKERFSANGTYPVHSSMPDPTIA
jgi:hypothetical protein